MSSDEEEIEFEPEFVGKDPLTFNLSGEGNPKPTPDPSGPTPDTPDNDDNQPDTTPEKPVTDGQEKPIPKEIPEPDNKPEPEVKSVSPSEPVPQPRPTPATQPQKPIAGENKPPDDFKPYKPVTEEDEQKRREFGKYARPAKKKILLPVVIPWENSKALQTQHGMGAFGAPRDAHIRIDKGSKPMSREKDSEAMLTYFSATNKYSSQKGSKQFGAYRSNVLTTVGREIPEEMARASDCIIPKQSGSNERPSQAGNVILMGSTRQQVSKVEYRKDMIQGMDMTSKTFISKMNQPNPNNHAGSTTMDHGRPHVLKVQGQIPNDPRCNMEIPRIFDTSHNISNHPTGTGAGYSGLGEFRKMNPVITGGYDMTYDEKVLVNQVIPFQTSPSIGTQSGSGGFGKLRDVANHAKIQF